MKTVSMLKFSRNHYEQVWNDDRTSFRSKPVGASLYEVRLVNEEIIEVTRDGVSKAVLVRPETSGYVYNCKKTFINARGQACGLFETLASCIHEDGTVWNSATLYTVCDYVIDEMRAAPKRPPMTVNRERVLDALKWSLSHKGEGVTVCGAWIAFCDCRWGVCNASLRNFETKVTFEVPETDELDKFTFARLASETLAARYVELVEKAVA